MEKIEMIDANTRRMTNAFGTFTQVRRNSRPGTRAQRGRAEWRTVKSELKVARREPLSSA